MLKRPTRPPAPVPLVALVLFSTLAVLLPACAEKEPPKPADRQGTSTKPTSTKAASTEAPPPAPAPPARSGSQVYLEHCATCHGVSGDGKGETVLDRPARSFLDGGFSFGNTVEAVFRTVTNGIGGTPMPGFKTTLSDAERRAVAAHVVGLGPEPVPEPGAEANLIVRDRPVFARGQFPAVADGAPEVTRGLLVGTTDGLTFQYAIDDVRLLAVRQGEFARRSDWSGRGGTPLEPQGRMLHAVAGGAPPPMFAARDDAGGDVPLHARLRSTRIEGTSAWVHYELAETAGARRVRAVVRERGEAVSHEHGSGFRRVIELSAIEGTVFLTSNEAIAMPRPDTADWIRSGALVARTRVTADDALLAPPLGALPECTVVHTVLVLPDDSDATYEALMQELER